MKSTYQIARSNDHEAGENQPKRFYIGRDKPKIKVWRQPANWHFEGRMYTREELRDRGEGDNWPEVSDDWYEINE